MLYQRRIADNQVLSAKLELHLRGSRYAGVGTQLLGIVSLGLAGFYSLDPEIMLTWATIHFYYSIFGGLAASIERSKPVGTFRSVLRCSMS